MKIFVSVIISVTARSANQSSSVGDYYWNHYSNVGLRGYANKKLYENLEFAQNECIELSSLCSG